MKNLSFSIRNHISYKALEDLLYTAGSGSKYWASSELEFESCVNKILYDERGVTIVDEEADKRIAYDLDLKKIKKGLTIMAKKYPQHFADFIKEDYDQITGDVFLQCCLFGEVIYS